MNSPRTHLGKTTRRDETSEVYGLAPSEALFPLDRTGSIGSMKENMFAQTPEGLDAGGKVIKTRKQNLFGILGGRESAQSQLSQPAMATLPTIQLGPLAQIHQEEEKQGILMPSAHSSLHSVEPSIQRQDSHQRIAKQRAQFRADRSQEAQHTPPVSMTQLASHIPKQRASVSDLATHKDEDPCTPSATSKKPAKEPNYESDSMKSKVEALPDNSFQSLMRRESTQLFKRPRQMSTTGHLSSEFTEHLNILRHVGNASPQSQGVGTSNSNSNSLRIQLKSKMRQLPGKNNVSPMSDECPTKPPTQQRKSVFASFSSFFQSFKQQKKQDDEGQESQKASPRFGQFDLGWGSAPPKPAPEPEIQKKKTQRLKKSIIGKAALPKLPSSPGLKKKDDLKADFVQRDILRSNGLQSQVSLMKSSFMKSQLLPGVALDDELFVSRFVIRYNSKWKVFWDMFMSLLASIKGFAIPYEIGFDYYWGHTFELASQGVFLVDLLFNSRQTFLHPQSGDEVTIPVLILRNYISTIGFWIDLLSTIPFFFIFENIIPEARLLHCFQILKIFRAFRHDTLSNQSEMCKLTLKLFFLIMGLVFYTHLTACAIFYVARIDKTWVPNMTRFENTSIYDSPPTSQYLGAVYTSIMMLTGNEINPTSDLMIAVSSFLTVVGALIIANVFGTMAVVVSTLNRRSQRFQDKIDMANTSMRNMKLPTILQDDIRLFMIQTQNNLDSQKELDIFMTMISPSLRNSVTKHIFINSVSANPILGGSDDLVDFLLNDVSTLLYLPEDTIIRQGQAGDSLFLIAKGDCTVWVKDHMRNAIFVRQLAQGEYFGEIAILSDVARTATVKSSNYCTMASLHKTVFFDLCNNFPDVLIKMKQKSTRYDDPWKRFKLLLLEQVDYFKPFKTDPDFFEDVQHHLQEEFIDPDTEIATDGEVCQSIVFIVQGLVELYSQDEDGKDVLMTSLNQGDVIGQFSVLFEEEFNFTARAVTNARILTLPQKFFMENQHLIDRLEEAVEEAEALVEENGIPLCDFKPFSTPQTKTIDKLKGIVNRLKDKNFRRTSIHDRLMKSDVADSASPESQQPDASPNAQQVVFQQKFASQFKKRFLNNMSGTPGLKAPAAKKKKRRSSIFNKGTNFASRESLSKQIAKLHGMLKKQQSSQHSSRSSSQSESSSFSSPRKNSSMRRKPESTIQESASIGGREDLTKSLGDKPYKNDDSSDDGASNLEAPEVSRKIYVLSERSHEDDSFEDRPSSRPVKRSFKLEREHRPEKLKVKKLDKKMASMILGGSPAADLSGGLRVPKRPNNPSEASIKRTRQFAQILKRKIKKE